jgi:hypothetical protein
MPFSPSAKQRLGPMTLVRNENCTNRYRHVTKIVAQK